ncbi:hypothetical protein K7640_07270 [Micromonospora sp. PLK6-60]|uniref:hypothetical protein n=1 Tax=Micromonospora sp. PLK6-60 TaxID=2873383 RepID=UPI001CA6FF69|nr:hypothetical protein [Micromonospora sp. PLK6-60]MBY8871644.1 hypothetical protein [Micromonospora sp. PLK6-60]
MARHDVRRVRRAGRRTGSALAAALAAGVLAAAALAGPATAGPVHGAAVTATGPGVVLPEPTAEPGDDPTPEPTATTDPVPTSAPPTVSPPPATTPPAPTTTAPAPTTTAPAPARPSPSTTSPTAKAPVPPPPPPPPPAAPPAGPPPPAQPPRGELGVRVTTEDLVLADTYWNARSTPATLLVTVANTGTVTEQVRLGYTLPPGLADAGTPGCAPVGTRGYRCGEWTAAPGARFSAQVRVRVDGDAWRRMPLSGSVRVNAYSPSASGTAADDEGFAVLFPPGPPVPGISLHADPLAFDITGAPSPLAVRLGNTGQVDARGRVELALPAGVSVPDLPAGCTAQPDGRTGCDVGVVAAGRSAELRFVVAATTAAQRQSPLAGAVSGLLDPRNGPSRKMQMSFRITAAAALTTPPVATVAPTGSQGVLAAAGQRGGDGGGLSVRHTAVLLVTVSGLLVILALGLATSSLRRRFADPPAAPAPGSTD